MNKTQISETLAGAKCFCGYTKSQHTGVQAYLMAVIAGISTDAQYLASQSACFSCIHPSIQDGAFSYLIQQFTGVTGTPQQIIALSPCASCVPPGQYESLKTYLLYLIAYQGGSFPTPTELLNLASQFINLTPVQQYAVLTYVAQQAGGGGPVPPTPTTITDSSTPSLQSAQLAYTSAGTSYLNPSYYYPAFTFTPIGNFKLTSMDMFLGRFGSTTGTLTARILATSAGVPIPTVVAESTNSINISTLSNVSYPSANTAVTWTFSDVLLQGGTTYAIELHSTNIAGGTALTFRQLNDNTYPLINLYTSTNYVTWAVQLASYTIWFKAYGYGVGSGNASGDCSVVITNGGGDSFECCVVTTDLVTNTGGGTGFSGDWIRS